MAETIQTTLPQWIIPISNTRVLVSASGAAFVIDCGGKRIREQIRQMRQQGRITGVEGLYITHYHNDHTDEAQALAEEWGCPVYACREQQDILEHPGAYRLPCLTPNPIRSVKAMSEGARMRWHEFEFTFSYYPGQTLYHGGLLVKKDGGETVFFVGDSWCPSGMDDYCLLNRNFLEPGMGYAYCLDVLRRLPKEALLINQHVEPAFRYSAAQIEIMAENFERRQALVAELVPWDDANYGVDEQWARFYPYGSEAEAGRTFKVQFIVTNHANEKRPYHVTPRLPMGWKIDTTAAEMVVDARREGTATFAITPPAGWRGLAVIAADVDVDHGRWELREWSEAMVRVK